MGRIKKKRRTQERENTNTNTKEEEDKEMFFRSRVAAEAAALMTYWRILRTRRPRSLPLSPLSSPSSSSSRTFSSHSEFIMEKERGQWSAFVAKKNSFSSSAATGRELN